jgi:hypothetical protein
MKKLFAIAMMVNFCTSIYAQPLVTDKHNLSSASTLLEDLFAGQWREEVTLYNKEEKPVAKFVINCENKIVLGGKFIEGLRTSTMGTGKLEVHSVVALDPVTHKVNLVSWTNLSPGIMMLNGVWSDTAKIMELSGTATNQLDHKPLKVRQVFTLVSKDEYIIDNYDQHWFQPEKRTAQYRCVRIKS